jgi:hypothetical protein
MSSEAETVNVNLHIDDYTNRVLGVIKEKYGLKDKSQALMYLVKTTGNKYADEVVRDEYVEHILKIEKAHEKKYGNRTMSIKELDNLFKA